MLQQSSTSLTNIKLPFSQALIRGQCVQEELTVGKLYISVKIQLEPLQRFGWVIYAEVYRLEPGTEKLSEAEASVPTTNVTIAHFYVSDE